MSDFCCALLPIVLLIYLLVKPKAMPPFRALPFMALLTYLIKLIYFKSDPLLLHATVIKGLLIALTPLLIIAGAIFLFRAQERTGALDVVRQWLNSISPNPVAQLMIVGWAFAFLVEGASGFGTPAALAAPILVGLGFKPVRVVLLCLIMNSAPVSFGAIGTPTWFGFSGISQLTMQDISAIAVYTTFLHACVALIIPLCALLYVLEWRIVKRNLFFVFISVCGCILPYMLVSRLSYEFPSLVGGLVGLVVSVIAARRRWGLAKEEGSRRVRSVISIGALIKATFPIWGTVLLLIVTRIPQLGIKRLLLDGTEFFSLVLGNLGTLVVSQSLVVELRTILGVDVNWMIKLLYVPSIIPFLVIGLVTFCLYRSGFREIVTSAKYVTQRMIKPTQALLGALVMVNLLMSGGESAPTMIIGQTLAGSLGGYWSYVASYLGAVGTFFSGSNTISNLMFAPIQVSIAEKLSLSTNKILALQSVGGAMGSMISINNIIAVCSVLGLSNKEGYVLKRTVGPMLLYGLIVGVLALLFL